MAIRIVIASNSAEIRQSIKAALEPGAGIEVCGEVATLDQLPAILQDLKPDLVLLESPAIETGGTFEPHVVQFHGYEVKIVLIRQLEDGSLELIGTEGLSIRVGKYEIPDQFGSALLAISGIEPAGGDGEGLAGDPRMIEPLTGKEQGILERMAEGKSNKEIADELVISKNTVRYHIGNILQKLSASNRTHAVVEAIKKRILRI